jgi:hypothetical protein
MTMWAVASLAVPVVVAVVAAIRSTWSPCGLSMLSTLTPVTERGRGYRYPVTAGWFVAGSLLGSLLLGLPAAAAAWGLGRLHAPATSWCAIGAVVALLTLAADRHWGGFRLPEHPRQVDETWLVRYRRWLYAAGFGVQIGSGFATYIMTTAVYLTVGLAVLTAQPVAALGICLTFGLVRGLAVLLTARVRSTDGLRRLHAWFARWAGWSTAVAAAAQAWAAVSLAGLALGAWWPSGLGFAVLVGVAIAAAPDAAGPDVSRVGTAPARPDRSGHQTELIALGIGQHDENVRGIRRPPQHARAQ